ncbi:M1 family metallopeptidase [Enterococcus nangangensis]|uniref:M1 family metallopeptidase n=1 Tax=Enterococcus nangangensis TaxID=2559926 RepID=UPI0010FA03F7|nr:M1 family metallopeptidase [Enterococcus nangangensis]
MTEFKHFYQFFQPEHYDLYLDINRATKIIAGVTTIKGVAKQAKISLHQKDLAVTKVSANGIDVPFTLEKATDALHIELATAGTVELSVTYTAPLTDTMMGIYPSYYEVAGVKKQLIGTQFETNSARQAFPGIDEPEAKATFALALKFDEHDGETILANMPENRCVDGVHYFDTTVKMSTYLVAFGFGELQSKLTTTKSGVKVGVFGTYAHQAKELDFALDIAKRSIEFYEDFFQTPYPLPHSWQLGLPDFSAGAMENWGLITYREAYLLLDADNSSLATKRRVATVIAHEVAHQWFGDLVTMKWWDDLWLNESFANMMEYVAVDALEPDFKIWEEFQTSDVPAALQRDATDGVQAVHVAVEDPAEVDALFDGAIVYAKGARMLVMVRALIGDEALRTGLKNYFAKHQYGNATGADLWQALGAASGLELKAIMDSWLEQPGYPVVTASVKDGQLTLSQQQFFVGDGKEIGRMWQIPLNSNYSVAPTIMAEKEITLGNYATLRQESGEPFRLNVGNNSHFIVKYDETLLADILADVTDFDAITQLQLLQDLRLLAEGEQLSFSDLVPLLPRFADSSAAVVSLALYRIANSLKRFVTPETAEETALKTFFNQLSGEQFTRLGLTPKAGEANDDQFVRQNVISAALYAENTAAIDAAHELFTQYADQLVNLDASIRPLVLVNEMKNFGTPALFQAFFASYPNTADASLKSALGSALTQTKDDALLDEVIAKFKDASAIKPQDLRGWYYNTLSNPHGEQKAWDWLRTNWEWLEETVGGDMSFTSYITVTAAVFKTPERLLEFKAFFEPKLTTPGLGREITMGIKVIESRVNLITKEKAAVNAAIAKAITE